MDIPSDNGEGGERNFHHSGGYDGLCPHHIEHTEKCGYVEASEESPCGYICRICEVQALIDALQSAEGISEENYEETVVQLVEIDVEKAGLLDEEMARLDIAKYEAAVLRLQELAGEQQTEEPVAAVESTGWSLDDDGILTIENDIGMGKWIIEKAPYKEQVVSAVIKSGVPSISDSTFSNCSNLKSIEIPDSVKSIGYAAFLGCSSLTSIEIPGRVTSIGQSAFYGCSGLTSIKIPGSVTSIGNSAFSSCSNLASIEILGSVTSIKEYAFSSCSSLSNIKIPGSVTSIGEYAFKDCSSLESVTISSGVASIEFRAFYGCSSLTSIEIPGSVATIGENAFEGCSSLGSITISSGVATIKRHAFVGCSKVTSIEIPGSVTSIGQMAFDGCSSLESITILSGVESIEGYAFRNCSSLTSIEIPGSVKNIDNGAFSDCSSLKSITIPSGVTRIGQSVFYSCSSLESITIPESVTRIGDFAFYNCSRLMSITMQGETPPTLDYTIFNNEWVGKDTKTIFVPKGKVETYQDASWLWRYYKNNITDETPPDSSGSGSNGNGSDGSGSSSPSSPENSNNTNNSSNTNNANDTSSQSSPVSPSYKIIDGADGIWILGSEGILVVCGNGGFDKFAGVEIDGVLLDRLHYGVSEGSTVIALKDTYLNTLPVGAHNFKLLWTDGSAETVFTVVERTSDNDKQNPNPKDGEPKTGDSTLVEIYATLAMISGLTYLRLCFADLAIGMSEETKKELVARLIRWARRGGKLRKFAALAVIFVLLVYYHSIGKKVQVKWNEAYEA